jgi:arginyl-tRNA synthetase
MTEAILKKNITGVLKGLGYTDEFDFTVEHPNDASHGDWSTNIALIAAKKVGKNPRELAEQIASGLSASLNSKDIKEISIAGPGFINIHFSNSYFEGSVRDIINQGEFYGRNGDLESQKTIIEFTDPNPFKKFHIGHMMSMIIGETLCNVAEWNGAEVKRAVYQGDVGMHVAKAVWGMVQNRAAFPHDEDSIDVKVRFLSNSYAFGSREFDGDARAKEEIVATNKILYEQSNHELNIYFEKGRGWSLEDFETIYKRIGTTYDFYFLESEVAQYGKDLVLSRVADEIFENSDGAVVYKAEKHGLHTRVFINSKGIPTYEAKELGLAQIKNERYQYDRSIVLTGNEQDGYFKVVMKALEEVSPELAEKTTHLSHGMLRLPSGKMSSRTGDVITASSMIDEVRESVAKKMEDRDFSEEEKDKIVELVAMAAIKYSVLKQTPSKDIIFDFEKSLSFEGDSGPYLLYTLLRAKSLITKAEEAKIPLSEVKQPEGWEAQEIEQKLYRFKELVSYTYSELAPQHMVTYLTEIASLFNSFYGSGKIVDADDPSSPYRVGITEAVSVVLTNGLDILGIKVPEKM